MNNNHKGMLYAFLSYAIWGSFPAFWKLLSHVDSWELLLGRVIWAFVFTFIAIHIIGMRKLFIADLKYLWTHKLLLLMLIGAAFVISLNWFLFIFAVTHNHLVESSLGYYINPLLTVLFGMLFYKEKLSKAQLTATFIAFIGVIILTLNYGSIPWIAIFISITFAIYGVLKKHIPLEATRGLVIETLLLLPIALSCYIYLWFNGEPAFLHINWQTNFLMMVSGILTAIPLILFAKGAQIIPLYLLGFLQYVSPTLMLLFGVLVYHEPFTPIDLVAFSVIWVALILFSGSLFYENRKVASLEK